ncbi:CrpP-related protein [Variovorax sp. RB2P76]|uniref:CrpP-related protein n=1 Tax=Variovorax sp. RB2P76 TaxID=3443736 RepID=UPI003F44B9D0
MTSDSLETEGADARARGLSLFDNPFYKRDALPSKTHDSAATWSRKAEAWTRGWRSEDARRQGRMAQARAEI